MCHVRSQQGDLVVHKLGDTEMCLFAHEDYIARFGEPVDFTLPEGAFMAGFDREPMPIAPYVLGSLPRAAPRFCWRSNNVHALHAAVECSAAVRFGPRPHACAGLLRGTGKARSLGITALTRRAHRTTSV